jgi:hypothetical protein
MVMAGLFSPKTQPVLPTVNPADTQNRMNMALAQRLASGGSNADQTSMPGVLAPTTVGRVPVLTGLN